MALTAEPHSEAERSITSKEVTAQKRVEPDSKKAAALTREAETRQMYAGDSSARGFSDTWGGPRRTKRGRGTLGGGARGT